MEFINPLLTKDEGTDEQEVSEEASKRSAQRRRGSSRFKFTEEHMELLRWVDKARYTSIEQVALYLRVSKVRAKTLTYRLEEQGYLTRKQFPGYPLVFMLSTAGKDMLESDTPAMDSKSGPGFIKHTLTVGWVMLGLLRADTTASQTARKGLERPLDLDDFTNEAELSAAYRQQVGVTMALLEAKSAREEVRGGRVLKSAAYYELGRRASRMPEATGVGWWLAVPKFVSKGLDLSTANAADRAHVPDLMLHVAETGFTRAFEIELSNKPASRRELVEAFVYAESSGGTHPFSSSVTWVCGSPAIASGVKQDHSTAFQNPPPGVAPRQVAMDVLMKSDLLRLIDKALDAVELTAEQSRLRHQRARDEGRWHVASAGLAAPCRCGAVCRAKYGAHATRQDAEELAEEL